MLFAGHCGRGEKRARVFKLLPEVTHALSAHISLVKAHYIINSSVRGNIPSPHGRKVYIGIIISLQISILPCMLTKN